MKAVLLSIQPKYCELIASGRKTVEIRKTKPKIETPFKVYIYCTKQNVPGEILLTYNKKVEGRNKGFRDNGDIPLAGKVIGEFICNEISGGYYVRPFSDTHQKETCLTYDEIEKYSKGKPLKSWHISDLVIYDKPKELSEFHMVKYTETKNGCSYGWTDEEETSWQVKRPPQSWCYVEELEG